MRACNDVDRCPVTMTAGTFSGMTVACPRTSQSSAMKAIAFTFLSPAVVNGRYDSRGWCASFSTPTTRLHVPSAVRRPRTTRPACSANVETAANAAADSSGNHDDATAPPSATSASEALADRETTPSGNRVQVQRHQYVPLHVHSDFSLLDGASHLSDLVARAAELGVPALALTDHGVLYGAIALVKACAASPIAVKPIIGNEMYIVNVDIPYVPQSEQNASVLTENEVGQAMTKEHPAAADTVADSKKKGKRPKPPRRFHLTVLAKNTVGYRNLVQLTTHAHLHGKVGPGNPRPCINKAMLFKHREGLMVSSGCLGGEVAQAILNDEPDLAISVARWFRDVFGEDYFMEIQDHGSVEDRKVNRAVLQIAANLGIQVIATNDSHFTSVLDAEAHDALICIQTGKTLEDEKRMRYAGNEYFKSVDEMRECFIDHMLPEEIDLALANTLKVAERVEPYDLFGDTRIPDFPIPPTSSRAWEADHLPYREGDHASYLGYVSRLGLEERLNARIASGLMRSNLNVSEVHRIYSVRLAFELDMIQQMGFSSYFLVVWDYIRFARSEGIPVGPGRGSAAGSIVAFALRITDVDPIEYNLLFERFLNPERKSMPDIDTDFSVEGREKVIRYVTQKYGEDRVAQIITFNRLTSKSVLKDVARVHKVPYADADKLAKLIPVVRGKPATLTKMLGIETPSKEFQQFLRSRPGYMDWIEKARRIEGTNKTFGIHAAGVVISAEPLTDFVPLSRAKHGETITQYPMEDVESLGLLKMDFLGLKNLSVIETAILFINNRRKRLREANVESKGDLDFSVDTLALDDSRTYEFLASGELDGIFQLDASAGMRNIVRELRPSSLDDISSILALYRPGPLDAGLIPKFIRRKHGVEPIVYDHPLLEPILRETYGIMVYQEQIMRIARDLAGYSLGQADILRRAMGKKKIADMEREQPRFVAGAMERGVSEDVATKLFETMILFAEYCFNKSHSTAYAYLTYQTAYLKANYPVEYTAALLRANSNQSDKLARYLADANASGVRVMPPSINRSELSFSVDSIPGNGQENLNVVLFGLEAIKTVGDVVGRAIIEERVANGPFNSVVDLIERLDSRVLNKRSLGSLVMCGAFDELHPNRKVLHEQLEVLLNLHRKVRDRRKRRLSASSRKLKKPVSADAEQATIAKEAAEWEEVQLHLRRQSETQPDFPMKELLAAEKATLGFYASGHPLNSLRQASVVLTSTPVARILGEQALDSHDAAPVVGEVEPLGIPSLAAVADGAEVICLCLIADLKHMVTAKGQKMAKWMMEDASGRVSAVVFPGAYSLCEAVVQVQSDAVQESTTSESAELVVSENARVIVWGKVDRESSGTSQVIVDDVQRVEDVQVLIASSPFDPKSQRHLI
jgi:DNA polymerase III subunit alpha